MYIAITIFIILGAISLFGIMLYMGLQAYKEQMIERVRVRYAAIHGWTFKQDNPNDFSMSGNWKEYAVNIQSVPIGEGESTQYFGRISIAITNPQQKILAIFHKKATDWGGHIPTDTPQDPFIPVKNLLHEDLTVWTSDMIFACSLLTDSLKERMSRNLNLWYPCACVFSGEQIQLYLPRPLNSDEDPQVYDSALKLLDEVLTVYNEYQ